MILLSSELLNPSVRRAMTPSKCERSLLPVIPEHGVCVERITVLNIARGKKVRTCCFTLEKIAKS